MLARIVPHRVNIDQQNGSELLIEVAFISADLLLVIQCVYDCQNYLSLRSSQRG